MEPPLEVGGEELVNGVHVTGAQGFIQGEYHPLVGRFLQNFLWVSQFLLNEAFQIENRERKVWRRGVVRIWEG